MRGRMLARATVRWLLDRDLVDPVPGEVVAAIPRWSLLAEPHAADDADVRDLLAALVGRGLVGPEILAERDGG